MFRRRGFHFITGIMAVAAIAVILAFGKDIRTSITGLKSSLSFPGQSAALVSNTGTSTAKVEYYFSRAGQEVQPQLVSIIQSAQKTLDIAIYSLTDSKIGAAITDAHERGVAVRVITDQQQAGGQTQKALLKDLVKAGIPVKDNTHSGLMHLKVTIVDGKVATTGSFNYTKSAENTNDEVFVVLRDETAAKDFDTEFEKMWDDNKNFTDYNSSIVNRNAIDSIPD